MAQLFGMHIAQVGLDENYNYSPKLYLIIDGFFSHIIQ
jgi:hypothetical protein